MDGPVLAICGRCDGDGEVDVEDTEFDHEPLDQMECIICPECDGSGSVPQESWWAR